MTEYSFNVKCIKSYTTGGTTYWEQDKGYSCKTKDFATFHVSKDDELVKSPFAFYELGAAVFREYFAIADTLSKLPRLYEWMDEEYKAEVSNTRFFDFLKEDIHRLGVAQGCDISDLCCCEIAYNLLNDDDPESAECLYEVYLTEKISAENLRQCG